MKNSKLTSLNSFIDEFFNKIKAVGIDASNYNMDHVVYQASSSQDYENSVKELKNYGELILEPVIGG